MSQQQEPCLGFYRRLARDAGENYALAQACRELDTARDLLGRKWDREAAEKIMWGVLGAAAGAIAAVVLA